MRIRRSDSDDNLIELGRCLSNLPFRNSLMMSKKPELMHPLLSNQFRHLCIWLANVGFENNCEEEFCKEIFITYHGVGKDYKML